MVPGPPTPSVRPACRRRPLASLALALLLAVGLLGLAGCQGGPGQPPRSVLLQALGLQIELTQQSIADALGLAAAGRPEVSRVRVERQETVRIGEGKGLHLTGRFDWRLADDPFRIDSPFELWLQRGERGQSWRLARPIGGEAPPLEAGSVVIGEAAADSEQPWRIDPLPLPADRAG